MFLEFSDWLIYADKEANQIYAKQELAEHCQCSFCRNFYRTVDECYPNMRHFLSKFGLEIEAPDSLLPITEELYQLTYESEGRVLRWGSDPFEIDGIPVTVEQDSENSCVILNLGFLKLPWVLPEPPETAKGSAATVDFFTEFKKEKTQQ